MAERINETMKDELLKGIIFTSLAEVVISVSIAVDFYNNERPHMSLNMMTPAEADSHTGEIPKRWTSYRENAIHTLQQVENTVHAPL